MRIDKDKYAALMRATASSVTAAAENTVLPPQIASLLSKLGIPADCSKQAPVVAMALPPTAQECSHQPKAATVTEKRPWQFHAALPLLDATEGNSVDANIALMCKGEVSASLKAVLAALGELTDWNSVSTTLVSNFKAGPSVSVFSIFSTRDWMTVPSIKALDNVAKTHMGKELFVCGDIRVSDCNKQILDHECVLEFSAASTVLEALSQESDVPYYADVPYHLVSIEFLMAD